MNKFIKKNKYKLFIIFVIALFLYTTFYVLYPWATSTLESIAYIRLQFQQTQEDSTYISNPDSIVMEYKKIEERIASKIQLSVTPASIFKFILAQASKNEIVLKDLSTNDTKQVNTKFIYPVNFKAQGSFKNINRFIASLEDGDFCIHVTNIKIESSDNGMVIANTRLELLAKRMP